MLPQIRVKKNILKIIITLFILLIMILTRYIALPSVDTSSALVKAGSSIDLISSATGANLAQVSISTLGLSPLMSSMILIRIFFLGTNKNISEKQRHKLTNTLVLVLSIIQGLSIALNFKYEITSTPFVLIVAQTTVLLVAGSFVLMWLANMNSSKGFGGLSTVILFNIILSRLNTLDELNEILSGGKFYFIIFLIIWMLFSIFVVIVLEKSEYRIPVHRIFINNKYVVDSYIPLKLNISSGMAFMYSFSILTIPQYLLLLINYYIPTNKFTSIILTYFSIQRIPGVITYMLVLFIFCISFAFVNVDVIKLSEDLRASGDFIEGVRPGKFTKLYIHNKVMLIGIINGLILTFLSGLPMLLAVGEPLLIDLATLVGIAMMMSSMVLNIVDEFRMFKLVKTYKSLFN